MKINDVIQEQILPTQKGFLGTARGMFSPLAKGVAQAIAPNAVKDYDAYKARHGKADPSRAMDLPGLTTPREQAIDNVIQSLIQQAGARKTIKMDDIVKALSSSTALNEGLTGEELTRTAEYVAAKLQQAGIRIVAPSAKANAGVTWDPNRSILTIGNQSYQKTKTGWKNWITKDPVVSANELMKVDAAFDKAVGRTAPAPTQQGLVTVKTNAGINVVKDLTGAWWRMDTRKRVTDPAEIQKLEQLLKNRQLVAKARGQTRV